MATSPSATTSTTEWRCSPTRSPHLAELDGHPHQTVLHYNYLGAVSHLFLCLEAVSRPLLHSIEWSFTTSSALELSLTTTSVLEWSFATSSALELSLTITSALERSFATSSALELSDHHLPWDCPSPPPLLWRCARSSAWGSRQRRKKNEKGCECILC